MADFLPMLLMVLPLCGVFAANDGRARTPPMGWRDWNQFQGNINQQIMEDAFRSLASSTLVAGQTKSLASFGYSDAGLDDAWQDCGSYGPNNYTYHDASGYPVVDKTAFPDMKKMTDVAHSLGLTAGWYGNNCKCKDHCTADDCFRGDVNSTLAFGFDSTKLDGCGKEENVALWYKMFNETISKMSGHKAMMIENCHNGPNTPTYDSAGELVCPFHTYRSSTDIRPVWGSILVNLMTVPALATANKSVPGCWAYPDMLEVGITNSQLPSPGGKMNCGPSQEDPCPPLSKIEARTHFGAWSIVSAPLVIGMDFSNTSNLELHFDTITNNDAIEVNQDYAGFSGSIFSQSSENQSFAPCGWWSNACSFPKTMSWYKPLSGRDERKSETAVLLMNNGNTTSDLSFNWSDVPNLKAATHCSVFSIWEKKSLGVINAPGFTAKAVGPRDSVFLTLSGCM